MRNALKLEKNDKFLSIDDNTYFDYDGQSILRDGMSILAISSVKSNTKVLTSKVFNPSFSIAESFNSSPKKQMSLRVKPQNIQHVGLKKMRTTNENGSSPPSALDKSADLVDEITSDPLNIVLT